MYKPKELRAINDDLEDAPNEASEILKHLPFYVQDALRIIDAVDAGHEVAIAQNAILVRYPSRMHMIRLYYTEEINDYLLDLAYPALI